jgi:hypothetical protein
MWISRTRSRINFRTNFFFFFCVRHKPNKQTLKSVAVCIRHDILRELAVWPANHRKMRRESIRRHTGCSLPTSVRVLCLEFSFSSPLCCGGRWLGVYHVGHRPIFLCLPGQVSFISTGFQSVSGKPGFNCLLNILEFDTIQTLSTKLSSLWQSCEYDTTSFESLLCGHSS